MTKNGKLKNKGISNWQHSARILTIPAGGEEGLLEAENGEVLDVTNDFSAIFTTKQGRDNGQKWLRVGENGKWFTLKNLKSEKFLLALDEKNTIVEGKIETLRTI